MITTTLHDQAYEVLTWPEVGANCLTLAKKIIESGETFDRIVALARGGVSISQSLADHLAVKKISVIRSELYTGVETKAKAPIITESLSSNIKGERILLIDDLADTGESLLFAKQYLYAHGPSEVKTATLASKPWTKLEPDFFVFSSKAWIIFPWETREHINTLSSMWKEKGIKPPQIQADLQVLGYSQDEIETFSKP